MSDQAPMTRIPPQLTPPREPSQSRSEARCVRLARSSCAAALPGQAAQGQPVNTGRDSWGGVLLVTFSFGNLSVRLACTEIFDFLGERKNVTSRRAAPGRFSQAFGIGLRR